MADVDALVLLGEPVELGGRLVRRAVVDEDQLDLVLRERLLQERVDAAVEVAARVVDRDDDADLDHTARAAAA